LDKKEKCTFKNFGRLKKLEQKMGMTKEEYQRWIAKMRLLGTLEENRQKEERTDPEGLKKFLFFLDDVFQIWRKNNSPIFKDMAATEIRIQRQRVLAKYPIR
jgi:hypothetical protein